MTLSEELGTGCVWTVYQNGIGYRRPLGGSYHLQKDRAKERKAKKILKHRDYRLVGVQRPRVTGDVDTLTLSGFTGAQ